MGTKSPHVLLVEDDGDTREMYSEYLNYCGLTVTPEGSARRALESARQDPPDVVVTDIAMPGMDGLELARRLRQDQDTRDIPIIAVSGQASSRARDAGADVVLMKPCEPDRLLHAIASVLERERER